MILTSLDGLGWLLLMLGPLLILQRALHREIQGVFLLSTCRGDVTLALFSLLFLPGVVLHELSHFIAAKILRVRTGKVSLLPRPLPNGKLQMGSVEVGQTDAARDSLIGLAPLAAGMGVTAYVALVQMNLLQAGDRLLIGDLAGFVERLTSLPNLPDFWIWFYLVFVVSSTMFPSESDRRAWLPLLLGIGLLFAIALLAGVGPWMIDHLAPAFNNGLKSIAAVFAVSLGIHLVLVIPFWMLRVLLSRVTGMRVL